MPSLREKFEADRNFLLRQTSSYLKGESAVLVDVNYQRKIAFDFLQQGKFLEALQALEIARDARSGITSFALKNQNGTSILIRDARNCEAAPQRGDEAFLMQLINVMRAAMEVVDLHEFSAEDKKIFKDDLKKFCQGFGNSLDQEKTAKALESRVRAIAEFLENKGISDVNSKLDIAKDFITFNDVHHNVVTISQVDGADKKTHNLVEAEVAFKGLTNEQKNEVTALENDARISEFEKALIRKYKTEILAGNHVIPARRHSLSSSSIFEKITLLDGKEVLSSYHASALASVAGDKSSRDKLTAANIEQVRKMADAELHFNSLNARKFGWGKDSEIVDRITKAAGKKSVTTSCVNRWRHLGSSSEFSGAKNYLTDFANSLRQSGVESNKGKKILSDVAYHISKPSGFFNKFKGIFVPSSKNALNKLNGIYLGEHGEQIRQTLREAVDVAQKVKTADSFLKIFDGENSNLAAACAFNRLTYQANKVPDNSANIELPKVRNITFCVYGRDRTGLKTTIESAEVLSKKLGIDVKKVDQKLTAASSSGHMAGSVYAGFGVVGCFGIKTVNKFILPKSRTENLKGALEISSESNKVLEPSLLSNLRKVFSSRSEGVVITRGSEHVIKYTLPALEKSSAHSNNTKPLSPSSASNLKNGKEVGKNSGILR